MPESNSQSNPSDKDKTETPTEPTDKELAAAQKADDKAAAKEAGESSKKTAKNDDYDPDSDPLVPDSALAQVIRIELQIGESPTLDALRAEHKAAEKNK